MANFFGFWAYSLKYLSIDLEEALYGVYEFSAGFGVIFMTITALFQRRKMKSFISELETIYDERKNQSNID